MDIPTLISYGINYLQDNYVTILAYLAAGGGVSLVLQFIKKLRKWDNKSWIQLVLGAFTVVAATADYVINNYATSPLSTIFGDQAPKILAAAMIMHRIAINPASKSIEKWLNNQIQAAAVKVADTALPVAAVQQITPMTSAGVSKMPAPVQYEVNEPVQSVPPLVQ